jgi:hypothetical protein
MSYVRLFGLIEKHLRGKRFATDADVKQGVAFWSQSFDTDFSYAGIEPW